MVHLQCQFAFFFLFFFFGFFFFTENKEENKTANNVRIKPHRENALEQKKML